MRLGGDETCSALRVRKGDLFQLGRHRLLCGDSTNEDDVERLLQSRCAQLVFAGPPYFNQRSYSKWNNYEDYIKDIGRVMDLSAHYLQRGGIVTWLIGRGSKEARDHASVHSVMLSQRGLLFQDAIAWIKPGANYTVRRSCHIAANGYYYPAFKWETILIYRKPGKMMQMAARERKIMARYHTDVWEAPLVPRQMQTIGHPAVCPLAIPQRCLWAYTRKGGVVYEPFGGSGTTLVAAEETGRSCLLMERIPQYCEIALRRWCSTTGQMVCRL